jgi:hypothetical protein
MSDDFGKYVFAALALLFAVLVWRAWQVKQASPSWPSVQGQILVSKARARNETGDQRGTPTHDWFTEVSYRYTVDGVAYTGNTLRAFGRNHFSQDQAEAELAPFAVGQSVPVYYDPANPARSVLIPG